MALALINANTNAKPIPPVLPVAFCLLPNKHDQTYDELIEQSNSIGKPFNPKQIITDYEAALMPIIEREVSVSYS